MPSVIVLSLALVAIGLALLGFFLFRLLREVRRAKAVLAAYRVALGDDTGLLRARSAAVRVAVAERRPDGGHTRTRIPLSEPAQTGGRP